MILNSHPGLETGHEKEERTSGAVAAVEGWVIAGFDPFFPGLKGGSTPAGAGSVGIDDLETSVREIMGVINVAAAEVLQAVCGKKNPDAALFDYLIAFCFLSDLHGILQSSASSALDSKSQASFFGSPFLNEEGLQFLDGIVRKGNHGVFLAQ